MCIRDRDTGIETPRFLAVHVLARIEIAHLAAKVDAQVRNCLLYTSDAADERSSVDLGGRRIIKKKKNE